MSGIADKLAISAARPKANSLHSKGKLTSFQRQTHFIPKANSLQARDKLTSGQKRGRQTKKRSPSAMAATLP
jgi:hypothetical protein